MVRPIAGVVNKEKKLSNKGPVTVLDGALIINPFRPDTKDDPPKKQQSTKRSENVVLVEPRPEMRMLKRDGIPRLEFSSSNIASAELEADGVVLVEFHSGASYRYGGFTPAIFKAWGDAPSAGSWFHRHVKLNPKAHPLVRAQTQTVGFESCGPTIVPAQRPPGHDSGGTAAPRVAIPGEPSVALFDPSAQACSHTLMRELAGGVCPVCPIGNTATPEHTLVAPQFPIGNVDTRSASAVESARDCHSSAGVDRELTPRPHAPACVDTSSEGTPTQSDVDIKARVDGSSPSPPTTVRPPIVEHNPPSSAPIGAAHGPAPEYMRRPLRTLTRAEATALLTKLQARRMRARLSTFIRGASGTGRDGAWHVLEDGELDWNFHHDAICDHTQLMFEEWYLAGLKPEQIAPTLNRWHTEAMIDVALAKGLSLDEQARAQARVDQIAGMRAHWQRPVDEYVEIPTLPTPTKIYGCGGGKYVQRTNDLAINVGPISLKSRIVMVFAIAWFWTRVPGWEVFCSSGTPSNVNRDSLATRDLVIDPWYIDTFSIEWTIRDDLNRIDKWGTTAGGSREARGTGTSVTGIHSDCILLDDPDDAAGVWSEAERRKTMLYWLALGNRVKDKTRPLRMIVQQNLHEEDLTTRTVAAGMPRLAIPIEFRPADRVKLYSAPFGWSDPRTFDGQALQPSRDTPKFLASERVRLGSHGFEAQYNCNPRALGGGMIKRIWYRFFKIEDPREEEKGDARPRPTGCVGSGGECGTILEHPAYVLKRKPNVHRRNDLEWMNEGQLVATLMLDWLTLSVDATFGSVKDTASAVGLVVGGGQAQRRFLFEDRTEPMTFVDTVKAIKALIRKWGCKRVLIEKKANGAAVIEELELQLAAGDVLGPDGKPITVVLEAVEVDGGKQARAAAMVPGIEAGLWYLLEGASWLEPYLAELTTFPNAKRDDRVDATSQLASRYREPDVKAKWRNMAKS